MKTGLDSCVDVILSLHNALGPTWHQNGCLYLEECYLTRSSVLCTIFHSCSKINNTKYCAAHTLDYLEKHVMIDFFVINQITAPFLTYFMQH